MSIRRKSCDPCFRARRKCDLAYPICERCQRNNKQCYYVYPSQLPTSDNAANPVDTAVIQPTTRELSYPQQLRHNRDGFRLNSSSTLQLDELRRSSIPKSLGHLGELPPVSWTTDLTWIFDLIRDFPLTFAKHAETVFIHKDLYGNSFPRPLQSAFGICAASISINERNRSVLFQALDSEISDILTPVLTSTLLEDLARLQATVLYQIIRLLHGSFEQRAVAEQQEFILRSYGLKLLQRANTELRSEVQPPTWETWILAESIRRTAIISFKLYTIYSAFKHGSCAEFAALNILPVSAHMSSSWESRDAYLQNSERDETMTYGDFTSLGPRREVGSFEKLLVSCRNPIGDQSVVE